MTQSAKIIFFIEIYAFIIKIDSITRSLYLCHYVQKGLSYLGE